MLNGWKTFILSIVAMFLTWYGVYLSMFTPDVFTGCLYAVFTAFGITRVGQKFAEGYISKHNGGTK